MILLDDVLMSDACDLSGGECAGDCDCNCDCSMDG